MYGWRGKLGLVIPSIGDTVFLELYRILPEGILITSVDLGVQNLVDSEFKAMVDKIEGAVKVLDYERVQAIIVCGTPPITKMGFDADKKIISKVEKMTGKPASTSITAEVSAMKLIGMEKIILISPFKQELNMHLKSYLNQCGFEVVNTKGFGIEKNSKLTEVPFDTAYMLAKEAYLEVKDQADGVFITCPRWPTVRSIAPLEKDLGVPVVTAAQALAWTALSLLKVREVRPGFGSLFNDFTKGGG